MKKYKSILAVLFSMILSLAMLAGCGSSGGQSGSEEAAEGETEGADQYKGQSLNIYTWDGMFPQDVLDDFQSSLDDAPADDLVIMPDHDVTIRISAHSNGLA